jgi:Zn-dependent metalloprotease
MTKSLLTFFSLLSIIFSLQVYAQKELKGSDANAMVSGAQHVRLSEYSASPSFIRYQPDNQPSAVDYTRNIGENVKMSPDLSLVLQKEEEDNFGYIHYRYFQSYKGIPIEFTSWFVHTKQQKVVSANGFVHRSFSANSKPVVTSSSAIQAALQFVGAEVYKWEIPAEEALIKEIENNSEATYFPVTELVFVCPDSDYSSDVYRLAYKMNIYAHEPMSRQLIYVDAITGQIIRAIEQIHHADVQGTAVTGYSGTQTIVTDQTGPSTYRLRESGRGNGIFTYNLLQGTSYGNAVDFTDSDNNWNNVNAQYDQYATDAHWGAEMTYDYFLYDHNRNSINNNGFALRSYVHYGQAYNNAFWNGQYMTYGDGNGNPLTSVDIAGHEIAHGLTTFTANLVYQGESGALNESFSDIFGAAVERYGRQSNWNWTMGEDLGFAFRSMSNPNAYGDPDTYFGNNWASLSGGDNGGVHTNSGVQNFWFYLLSEGGTGTNDKGNSYSVSGIGFDNAENIAFRNLTVYLGQNSNFSDARFYSIQSAIDLYGACSNEVEEVTNAWYAVGVGNVYNPDVVADFTSSVTNSCSFPFTVNFSNQSANGGTFLWNFGDGTTSTLVNPSHTYTSYGSYSVSLYTNGGTCGNDDTVFVNLVNVFDSLPCIVTMPSNGVAPIQNSCSGFLYDSGGPTGNYGANEFSVITIAPTGASTVTIFVNHFDIEPGDDGTCNYDKLYVYDGPNTSSPLLGTYCNTTGMTGFTSSGGAVTVVFDSDPGLELSGFELEWVCNSENSAPIARFENDVNWSCTGDIQFEDLSNNNPNSWYWDFGDGNSSTAQNPVHHYNSNGLYNVALTASNSFGAGSVTKTQLVEINFDNDSLPETFGDTTCPGNTQKLFAVSNGQHFWYENSYDTTILFVGDTLVTPTLYTTTSYFVEKENPIEWDTVGALDNQIGSGGYFSGDQSLIFDVFNPMILESVAIYSNNSDSKVVEIRDGNGVIVASKTVSPVVGFNRIYLGFSLQPGTNYRIGLPAGSSPGWFRNSNGASYPYSIADLMEITGSTASNASAYYYFFYDWYVRKPICTSSRVEVNAVIDECVGTPEIISSTGFAVFPNPANSEFTLLLGKSDVQETTKMTVFNSVGAVQHMQFLNQSETKFDVSNYPAGMYLIHILSGDQSYYEKLIIE